MHEESGFISRPLSLRVRAVRGTTGILERVGVARLRDPWRDLPAKFHRRRRRDDELNDARIRHDDHGSPP